MKKKIIALLLGVVLVISAAGCGTKAGDAVTENTENTESTGNANGVMSASAEFELKASDYVTLCDYSSVPVTITGDYEVEDADAVTYFEEIFTSNGPFYQEDTTKTTIGEGDIVNVDYVGKLDGEAFQGGTAAGQYIDVYNNASADGSTTFIEGFTEGLKGASVGSEIDCDVTFPEDYSNTDLAGKAVVFTFTVNSIQKVMGLEDVNDAFAREQFNVDTVDEMYQVIKEDLMNAAEYYRKRDINTAVQSYLIDNCTVEVPADYLAARISDYRAQVIRANCDGDESQLESYLSTYYGKTVEEAEAEWAEGIEQNIVLELILEAIAEKEGIASEDAEYDEYIQAMITNNGYESEEAMYELYGYGDASYGEKYVKQLYVDQLALNHLVERANVTIEPAAADTDGTGAVEATEGVEETETQE